MERTVTMWGQPRTVSVHRKSKSVWRAVGEYKGARLETKERSASSALSLWADAAKYRGG